MFRIVGLLRNIPKIDSIIKKDKSFKIHGARNFEIKMKIT